MDPKSGSGGRGARPDGRNLQRSKSRRGWTHHVVRTIEDRLRTVHGQHPGRERFLNDLGWFVSWSCNCQRGLRGLTSTNMTGQPILWTTPHPTMIQCVRWDIAMPSSARASLEPLLDVLDNCFRTSPNTQLEATKT